MKSIYQTILFLALLLLSVPLANAQYTIWVSPQGSGDFSGTDSSNACAGLQTTIQWIRTQSGFTGDQTVTLNILPGTYRMRDDSTVS